MTIRGFFYYLFCVAVLLVDSTFAMERHMMEPRVPSR